MDKLEIREWREGEPATGASSRGKSKKSSSPRKIRMTTPRKKTNTYPALTMRVLNALRRLINRNPSKLGTGLACALHNFSYSAVRL